MYRPALKLGFLFLLILCSCRQHSKVETAFYYWKTGFLLNNQQQKLAKANGATTLYLRYFDVKWDAARKRAYPNAVIKLDGQLSNFSVVPVVYIANRTFEQIEASGVDSLAIHCATLIKQISAGKNLSYHKVQIDCDWTLKTRATYFAFLRSLQKHIAGKLEVTIRLHQAKYPQITGVPPVSNGVLMFYNMGKLNASLTQANSIYNYNDAAQYVDEIKNYPLHLDVALPCFSWAIHIRDGHIIQVYEKIKRKDLYSSSFKIIKGTSSFVALKSFFMAGVYIKQNDIFKLEEINAKVLLQAADQLAAKLPASTKRTIIYYEMANLNPAEFTAETIRKVSACF